MRDLRLGYTHGEDEELYGLYLAPEDRSTHVYVLGSSDVGKPKVSVSITNNLIYQKTQKGIANQVFLVSLLVLGWQQLLKHVYHSH